MSLKFRVMLICLLALALVTAVVPAVNTAASTPAADSWAIYWYLCGSDLESEYASASFDLLEMLEVRLPPNVTVVIQTGGAEMWQNNFVDAAAIERYAYHKNSLRRVDRAPQANMGDPDTLRDFLLFCESKYPADNKMVLFWDHGGGSIWGAVCDENYDFDALTLPEMTEAFASVYQGQTEPLEVVGFDCCLMSTLETARVFQPYASYFVASQEWEPGTGWDYAGWLSALADDPGMSGAELGKAICDTYMASCEAFGTADEATLSVTDLGRLDPLLDAFGRMGNEVLTGAVNTPSVCGAFARSAERAENYGGNSNTEGYANMVDLADLVKHAKPLLPESASDLLTALNDAVVYRVNGRYRRRASGLSVFYSYDGDAHELELYGDVVVDPLYYHFLRYSISGELPAEIADEWIGAAPRAVFSGNMTVEVTEEVFARLLIDPDDIAAVKSVFYNLAYYSDEYDVAIYLGRDNDIYANWEAGIFVDNFRGVWGALDGCLCYLEVVYESEAYNLYSVPIYLNSQLCSMRVSYDFKAEEWAILGIREDIDDQGMGDKTLLQLEVGDQVTPVLYTSSLSGGDDIYEFADESVTVQDDTAFAETDLGDGTFVVVFEVVDVANESYFSDAVWFRIVDGNIYIVSE